MLIRPRFGVEVEFTTLYADQATDAITERGIRCTNEDYNHYTRQHWKIVPDSSCGNELVSPPLMWEDRHIVRTAVNALVDAGAEITIDCGLHVHHEWPWWTKTNDVEWMDHDEDYDDEDDEPTCGDPDCESSGCRPRRRDRNSNPVEYSYAENRLRRVWNVYSACRPLLGQLLSPSRLDPSSQFCEWNEATYTGAVSFSERRRAVNFCSLPKYATIEFRQHQGSLNPRKILSWVELTRQMVHAASVPEPTESFDTYEALFGKLSLSTLTYIRSRCADNFEQVMSEVRDNLTSVAV